MFINFVEILSYLMESVTIKGMTFVPYLKREEIAKQVERVAAEIRRDFEGKQPPLFICVLNGAFVFACSVRAVCPNRRLRLCATSRMKAPALPEW